MEKLGIDNENEVIDSISDDNLYGFCIITKQEIETEKDYINTCEVCGIKMPHDLDDVCKDCYKKSGKNEE